MDLSKLTDEQLELAGKIAEKAKAKGLNPDFVLPMVMQESGFNHKITSKKGAQGVMQITPDTAATYKCADPENVDQNIDCGLNILSDLVSKSHIGNDPYKVLAGYNAGPNTSFFKSGNLSDLPDETIQHMGKVSQHYGGELPAVMGQATQEEAQAPAATPSDVTSAPVPPGSSEVAQSTVPYAVIGGAIGAGGATALEASKKVLPFIPNWANIAMQNPINPNKASTRASLQRYTNSQIAPNLRIPLGELEKVTGGNKIRTMSEVQNALDSIKEVPEVKGTKPVYKPSSAGSTVLTDTGKVLPYSTPGRPALDLTSYEYKPSLMNNAVDRVKNAGEVVKGALPSFGRVGIGALGGALAGKEAYDAFNQYQKEGGGWHIPSLRNAAQFTSALGGGLSVLPFGVTQAAGAGLSALGQLPAAYDYITDMNERRKAATKEDVNRMLVNVDAMGNPY